MTHVIEEYHGHSHHEILFRGSTGDHTISITPTSILCTCPSFLYRRDCKHIKEVMDKMLWSIKDKKPSRKTWKSSVDSLNEMMNGYAYTSDEIVALYGMPNTGKTLLALQEAFWLASEGEVVLFIDTEGGIRSFAQQWAPVFIKRFGDIKGNIFFERRTTIESLLEFFGDKVRVVFKSAKGGDKGKVEARFIETIESGLFKAIEDNSISFLIVDSISAPIRAAIPASQENYPTRADLTARLFSWLVRAQEEYDIGVLVSNHATANPANPYAGSYAFIRGGIVVEHYSKRIIYLDRREARAFKSIRRFWLVRMENKPDWSDVAFAEITDEGYKSLKFDERYLTDEEKRRVKGRSG